jgi:hypothetical protein
MVIRKLGENCIETNVDLTEILRHIIVSVLRRPRGQIHPVTVNRSEKTFFFPVNPFPENLNGPGPVRDRSRDRRATAQTTRQGREGTGRKGRKGEGKERVCGEERNGPEERMDRYIDGQRREKEIERREGGRAGE